MTDDKVVASTSTKGLAAAFLVAILASVHGKNPLFLT